MKKKILRAVRLESEFSRTLNHKHSSVLILNLKHKKLKTSQTHLHNVSYLYRKYKVFAVENDLAYAIVICK